jgi:hypothetical protein
MGREIQLTTTRNTYLQINGVEAYGWGMSSMRRTSTSTSRTMRTTGGMVRPSGNSSKLTLQNASMSKTYSAAYSADKALMPGAPRTAITHSGVGQWWKAEF